MALRRPYFNEHQIIQGQYATLGQYIDDQGNDYEGPYHVLPTGQIFTGFKQEPGRPNRELFPKIVDVSEEVRTYNNLKNIPRISYYQTPTAYNKGPNLDQYKAGSYSRYFVQKRTNPIDTIIEIDFEQYANINNKKSTGINSKVYNSTVIDWKISLLPAQSVRELNLDTVLKAQKDFPGLSYYLNNPLQYYK